MICVDLLFQACRGYQHEDPVPDVHSDEDVVDGIDNEVVVDAGVSPTLPNASDFLFCYSVTEGVYEPFTRGRNYDNVPFEKCQFCQVL